MIEIPATVEIARVPKAEKQLMKISRDWITSDERSPGIHASGMLDPRIEYFKQVSPKPVPDRLINMFLIGKVLHAFILSAVDEFTGVNWASDGGSLESKELGITYSPDKILGGVVREVKTSRKFTPPDVKKGDLDFYIEQVLIYMAATDTLVSQIWVLFLNLKNKNYQYDPEYRCYNVHIDQAGLKMVKKQIKDTVKVMKEALKTKDHKLLPLCRSWKCGRTQCEYFDDCKPEGRWISLEDEQAVQKAKKRKKRKGA